MPSVLGIDTSNYTTSAALWNDGVVSQNKMPLPVKKGELGLRQSDAVFHHVVQLPQVLSALSLADSEIEAVGASDRPRSMESSYMPCFLAGLGSAKAISQVCRLPLHLFSHQQGHIAAALYSAGKVDLLKTRFLAFHVSGGTTEAVLATPEKKQVFQTEIVARSLDLKGGQAVDRVGAMLGLPFPAGKELEALAGRVKRPSAVRATLKGADCSLSGIENRCRAMLDRGTPKEEIAAFCLASILAALDGMAEVLLKQYGELPLVFAGGVMSDGILRIALEKKYGAFFAEPEYSCDNAAGIAVLAAWKEGYLQ
ncbi:tRNA N6-adenosine threonylcarbamoyltransferase [Caprobacter fermentans]|uniref:N(6)-L-threonylcarbamoyladenine synthase n=1 Tax=Caproicibacter fermentans TaxID=2576756 RepID=A0A6N8I4U5_9FIRM|nr:peptidase M22 [Caproicibacter fermentans]MVB12985.1 tRNA N6-adenosine threonylcarbamoyltransferase [Caproicibacter fermentans]QNK41253.1 peptidase M22 [Caproicibacter fermentans]